MTVTAGRENGAAELTVADEGPGLPDDRGRSSSASSTGDAASGAGLGLAIARELAERMDGSIAPTRGRGHGVHARAAGGRPGDAALAAAAAGRAGARGLQRRRRLRRARRRTPRPRKEVRTTRVEVVEGLGRKGGLRPAEQLYDRLSPGVVTVISLVRRRGAQRCCARRRRRGRPGLGLRARRRRLRRHQRARGHHGRRRRTPSARRRSTSSSATATACAAKIVGNDPNADVALLKIDPAGLDAHAAPARQLARPDRGRAGGRHRQPVRRAPVAVGRRDLGARPHHRVAHASSRSATRSRPTPPSTRATPAARC